MRQPISIPKRSPWVSQMRVIGALFNHQAASRFGEYRLGFVWMLLEPLIGVLVVGLVIGAIAERTVPEIPYAFFVLNGMLMLKLLTSCMSIGVNVVSAGNTGLLVYPTVKPLDPLLARFVFEFLSIGFSFVLFCIVGEWLGINLALQDLDILAATYVLTWLIGSGLGLILGVAAAHFNDLEKIVPVLQRPLLFVSAVLFPISAMPNSAKNILLWNPLVHTIELSRHALFPFYHAEGADLAYPTFFAIIVTSLGLTLFNINRNFLSQR